jgi:hypothetical protein
MMAGIVIARANPEIPGSVPLALLHDIIAEEIAKTPNPFFGHTDLEGLRVRLLMHLLSYAKVIKDANS